MNNKIIAEALRRYRKQKRLSVQDAALLLKERNISVSPGLYMSGKTAPTSPAFPLLLTLYNLYDIPDLQQALGMPPDRQHSPHAAQS